MSDYYDKLGNILRNRLDADDQDIFDAWDSRHGKYRKAGNTKEQRPPPKVKVETKRVPVPPELIEDFAVLTVLPGVPLDDCKKAWKRLLKKHHPDVVRGKAKQEEASRIIRRINIAYKRIECWFETGKIISPQDIQ